MSKKVALLVKATFYARVVADVDDSFDEKAEGDLWYGDDSPITDEIASAVATEAASHFISCIDCGMYDCIDEVKNDIEMPYDPEWDEKCK